MTDIQPKHPAKATPAGSGLVPGGGVLPFPHVTGYWVNRLAAAFRTVVDRELKVLDLTRRQVGMLIHVERALVLGEGCPTASDLTRSLGVDSTAVTRMIDRLEEKGLLERTPDPDDGRRLLVKLTGGAETMMPKLKATARRVEAQFEGGVDPADLETFQRVVMKMLENVGEAGGAGIGHD